MPEMTGFSVERDALERAANELHSIHHELAGKVNLRYEMEPAQVGHAELATAIADFQQGSRHATLCLFADTEAAADRLALNADNYWHAQQQIEDVFKGHIG
ncbi:MAG TPA: hypothetical protein VEO01_38810 [Pseudonocardiaceae bacterium]|nr:hypothetical protein [Pseudonocardiaceae bacterium]